MAKSCQVLHDQLKEKWVSLLPKVLVMKRKKEKFLIVFVKKLTVKSFLATVCCTESFDIRTTRDVYHGWCILSTFVFHPRKVLWAHRVKETVSGNLSIVIACVVVLSFSFKTSVSSTKRCARALGTGRLVSTSWLKGNTDDCYAGYRSGNCH